MKIFRQILTNSLYILVIGGITLGVSLYSVARNASQYARNAETVSVYVSKKEVRLTVQAGGVVDSIGVDNNTYIQEGDDILTIQNPILTERIALYESFPDNTSALTELAALRAEQANLTLQAPSDGVIRLDLSEGAVINKYDSAGVIYSENSVDLIGHFRLGQYNDFENQDNTTYQVVSERLRQSFDVEPTATREIIERDGIRLIGVYFQLVNPDQGVNLLQNEELSLRAVNTETSDQMQPLEYLFPFLYEQES